MTSLIELLLIIALILALYLFNSHREESKPVMIKAPFKKEWANELYKMSYRVPFIWFIDEEGKDKKTKATKTLIADANLMHVFNYRSYTALRFAFVMGSVLVYLLLSVLIDNSQLIARVLFNIQSVDMSGNTANTILHIKIYTIFILGILNLLPNFLLKRRAKIELYAQLRDIPIIQLFILLMLRSKRPVGDILFALSKINTKYKEVFDNGYRIFLRNKDDGLEYIKERFGESRFKETINVLREIGDYSREDSIKLLENNMAQVIETSNSLKRRNDLSKSVLSQGTIAIPFVAVVLLGLLPLAILGMSIFNRITGLGI